MAYANLAELYVVVTIIIIVEERQGNEDILVCIYGTLDVKDSLFFLSLVWAIYNSLTQQ